jgi:hypothetical protein
MLSCSHSNPYGIVYIVQTLEYIRFQFCFFFFKRRCSIYTLNYRTFQFKGLIIWFGPKTNPQLNYLFVRCMSFCIIGIMLQHAYFGLSIEALTRCSYQCFYVSTAAKCSTIALRRDYFSILCFMLRCLSYVSCLNSMPCF